MVQAMETNLQKLLEGTKQYRVPLYQRTYSWKTDQLQRLWDDLVKLTEDRHERGGDATHFIGSLVLAPSPTVGPAGLQEFLVVDGQQRLTTLTLLLSAIRDHRAETENPSHIDRVNEKYLINKWEDGLPTKVLPTQKDRESYLACIRRTPSAGGGDPIGAAYRFFRARLTEVDDPDDDLDIDRLEDAVISGLSLVCVTAQAGDNAHRIFESLNNTGLRLTQGDLIRNYLFMRLPTRGEYVYDTVWLPLQESLDAQQLELLFWLDIVQSDDSVKQSDTYSMQAARLDRLVDESQIEAEVERFARLGSLLAVLLDPSKEPDAEVRLRLQRLNDWGTTTVYPVLLHLLDRRARGDATSDDLVAAMRYLESFFVRRVIVGKATASINRILLRAVTEIRDQSPVQDALRDYLSTGRKYFATDAEVRSAVRTVPFYWSGRSNQRRLVLRWIEESFENKEPVGTDALTIEHVMPQTMTDAWRGEISAGLESGEEVDTVHQGLLHTLGNLTLTGYNSELSNDPFSVKREQLETSGLRMNQEIAKSSVWNRETIQTRADRLAERIIAIWPGPNPSAEADEDSAIWQTLAQVLAEIPAGAWTTYGDVAAVVGTHPVPLGGRLANHPVVYAHRVLAAGGVVAANFRWLDESRTETAREILEQEGVQFDDAGHADPSQRLTAEELAVLAGLSTEHAEAPLPGDDDASGRRERFLQQLRDRQPLAVANGVAAMLEAWTHLGGGLDFGNGEVTSCFLMADGAEPTWPFTVYPTGKVEVVFQYMASRRPFDDVALRVEFLDRLNAIDGISLPPSKLELRPGFDIELLADESCRDAVITELGWFMGQVRAASAGAN
jgi:alkylated DNA nucleotide flippase Atl1